MQEEITEEDLNEALKEMHTYMDITPSDLKKIYTLSLRHAKKKLLSPKAREIMTKDVISITQDASLDPFLCKRCYDRSYHYRNLNNAGI